MLTPSQRRKSQNRASQRAFRQRKESHVKNVIKRLEELQEQHRDLMQSYNDEAGKVAELKARVTELSEQLRTAKQYQDNVDSSLASSGSSDVFDEFDESSFWYPFRQPVDALYEGEGVYHSRVLSLDLHEELCSWPLPG